MPNNKIPDDIMLAAQNAICRMNVAANTTGNLRVIARAIAAERERCAGIAEERRPAYCDNPDYYGGSVSAALAIAAEIRRGV